MKACDSMPVLAEVLWSVLHVVVKARLKSSKVHPITYDKHHSDIRNSFIGVKDIWVIHLITLMRTPSKSLSIWVSLFLYKKGTEPIRPHRLFYCTSFFPNEFWKGSHCLERLLVRSSLKSSTHNAPSGWQAKELGDRSAFLHSASRMI